MLKIHLLNTKFTEKKGSIVNNVKFRVPWIVKTDEGLLLTKPTPAKNQIMVFSTFLIYGGDLNLNNNLRRISWGSDS
jgi:hypothetical protein